MTNPQRQVVIFMLVFAMLNVVDWAAYKRLRWRYNLFITLAAAVITQFLMWVVLNV